MLSQQVAEVKKKMASMTEKKGAWMTSFSEKKREWKGKYAYS
jgi:hypothetical protein